MHILIIGGGLAGVSVATTLQRTLRKSHPSAQITLVDPKPFTAIRWATQRAFFHPPTRAAHAVPFSAFLTANNISHIEASVAALTPTEITLDTEETLPFDLCLIATGATNSYELLNAPPAPLEERLDALAAAGAELLEAPSVLIVGGGPVGAELAGDIAGFATPASRPAVTLVHAGERLVDAMTPVASARLKAQLEARGVRVVLGDRAVEEDGVWKLETAGEELEAAQVVNCVGLSPCNEFAAEGLPDVIDEAGWIKVDEYFRVPGTDGRIFALGDCTDNAKKTGAVVTANRSVVAHNMAVSVAALSAGSELESCVSRMKKRLDARPVFLTTSGPTTGVASTPMGAVTFGLPWLKNKTMFIFRAKQEMGI